LAYCTREDVESKLPVGDIILFTDDVQSEQVNEDNLARAIEDADSVINGYVRARYRVPFDTVPKLIRQISTDLTIYNLASRKYTVEMPDTYRNRYTDSIKLLRAIKSGEVDMEDVPEPEPQVPDAVVTNKTKSDRVFSGERLSQW